METLEEAPSLGLLIEPRVDLMISYINFDIEYFYGE